MGFDSALGNSHPFFQGKTRLDFLEAFGIREQAGYLRRSSSAPDEQPSWLATKSLAYREVLSVQPRVVQRFRFCRVVGRVG